MAKKVKRTAGRNRRKPTQRPNVDWITANNVSSDVVFAAADVAINAPESDGQTPSMNVTAYTGDLLQLPNFPYPAVINTAGVRAMNGEQLPFLRDHAVRRPVGHGKPEINVANLTHNGRLSLANKDRDEVLQANGEGFKWQASVGGRIPNIRKNTQTIKEGQRVAVNGRTFAGPIVVINAFLWKETSLTAVGADEGVASASIAASHERVIPMNEFEKWLEDQGIDSATLTASQVSNLKAAWSALQADDDDDDNSGVAANAGGGRQAAVIDTEAIVQAATRAAMTAATEQSRRGRRIDNLFASYTETSLTQEQVDELRANVENGEITEDRAHLQLIQAMRSRGGTSNVGGSNGGGRGPDRNMQIVASLGLKAGLTEEQTHEMLVEASATDDQAEAAITRGRNKFGIKSLIRAVCQQEGHHVDEVDDDAIACALNASRRDLSEIRASSSGFSTVSVAGILSRLANKSMLAAYGEADNGGVALRIASTTSTNDFKKFSRYRMTEAGVMDLVPATGEIPHGELSEEAYENQVKTYGKMFSLSRQMMRNDDLDAFLQIPRMLGRQGRHSLEQIVITTLVDAPTGTTTGFFRSAPNDGQSANYLAGAGTALGMDSLELAYELFLNQVDSGGKPIMIDPEFLLTTNADIIMGRKLFTDTQYRLGSDAAANELINNQWQGMFNPVKSSYLHRLGASPSSTQWYLGANPTLDVSAIQVAFLDGQQTPMISSAETTFNTLGMQMRGIFDFGVALQDPRAMVKVQGLAATALAALAEGQNQGKLPTGPGSGAAAKAAQSAK